MRFHLEVLCGGRLPCVAVLVGGGGGLQGPPSDVGGGPPQQGSVTHHLLAVGGRGDVEGRARAREGGQGCKITSSFQFKSCCALN